MNAGAVLVRGDGLRKSYEARVALDDVSVAWRGGCVVGVIGVNGAGKSTLLDVLSGSVVPDHGRTWIAGRETTGWPLGRVARMGLVRAFQDGNVIGGMSVLENAQMAAEPRQLASLQAALLGRRDRQAEAVAREALRDCGLSARSDELGRAISHGQRKMLSMAMCVAAHPRILFLDEPFAGVEADSLPFMSALILRLRAAGALIVVVEHDTERLEKLADAVVVMTSGRALERGPHESPSGALEQNTRG